jgi:hypothetical protein
VCKKKTLLVTTGGVFTLLLRNEHLLHERLAIDFKAVEIDA